MPYNPYFPASYQPVPQASPMPVQMPQMQAPPPPAPAQYQYYTYTVVNSEDEADRVPLDLNAQLLILNLNNGKAYVRKRDGLGQYTMDKFLVIKEENEKTVSYVTKEEFEEFKQMIAKSGVKDDE